MEYRANELSELVLRSLANMRIAKARFLPLTIKLPSAAALITQIKLRDDFLRNIRRIRIGLGRRMIQPGLARRRTPAARKSQARPKTNGYGCQSRRHLVN